MTDLKKALLEFFASEAKENVAWIDDDPDAVELGDDLEIKKRYHRIKYDGDFDLDRLIEVFMHNAVIAISEPITYQHLPSPSPKYAIEKTSLGIGEMALIASYDFRIPADDFKRMFGDPATCTIETLTVTGEKDGVAYLSPSPKDAVAGEGDK